MASGDNVMTGIRRAMVGMPARLMFSVLLRSGRPHVRNEGMGDGGERFKMRGEQPGVTSSLAS